MQSNAWLSRCFPTAVCTSTAVLPTERMAAYELFHSTLETGNVRNNALSFAFACLVIIIAHFRIFSSTSTASLNGFQTKRRKKEVF